MESDKQHIQKVNQEQPEGRKKRYHSPHLEDYGPIRNITLGGTIGGSGDSQYANTWP